MHKLWWWPAIPIVSWLKRSTSSLWSLYRKIVWKRSCDVSRVLWQWTMFQLTSDLSYCLISLVCMVHRRWWGQGSQSDRENTCILIDWAFWHVLGPHMVAVATRHGPWHTYSWAKVYKGYIMGQLKLSWWGKIYTPFIFWHKWVAMGQEHHLNFTHGFWASQICQPGPRATLLWKMGKGWTWDQARCCSHNDVLQASSSWADSHFSANLPKCP